MTRLLYPSKAHEDWIEVDVGAISDDSGRRYTPKDVKKIEGNLEEHIKTNASTSTVGHVKLNDSLTSTSKTEAATADAVRRVSEKVDKSTPPDATTSRKGIVQLNNSLTSTSSTQAATPYAVKQVNDKLIGREVQIGYGAKAEASKGIAIGENAEALSNFGMAIGLYAESKGASSLAIGRGAKSESGIAIGFDAKESGRASGISIGDRSAAEATWTIAIGESAKAHGDESIAIGYLARALNKREGVLGGTGAVTVDWKIPGSLRVEGTKNFEIPHPRPEKRDTHVIRHGAVESPTPGDTLYRYFVKFKDKIAQIALCGSDSLIEAFTAPLGGGGG